MKKLIIDTGFFVALFSKTDHHHLKALSIIKKIENIELWTTWPVLTETSHLLQSRGYSHILPRLFEMAEMSGYQIYPLEEKHLPRISSLLKKYNQLPADLADISLVILAEELGSGEILSTDTRDFETYRWKNRKPFHNLFAI